MKTIIAGGRNIIDRDLVFHAIKESGFSITEVVCGEARGVDTLGKIWGNENSVSVKSFPADWKSYGRAAGPIRNEQMAEYGEALILVWDGKGKGSGSMLKIAKKTAKKKEFKIFEFLVDSVKEI